MCARIRSEEQHEDSPFPAHASCVDCVRLCTPLLAITASSVHSTRHRNWGVSTILSSTYRELYAKICPLAATLAYMNWMQHTITQCTPYCTEEVVLLEKGLSPFRISTLIFRQYSERIFIAKAKHEIHIRVLCISKSGHFCCCHCSCYRYYCPSMVTALQLSALSRTLSAESPLNDKNNTMRHESKNVIWKRWKNDSFCSKSSHNNVLKYCTRALNRPVYT
jgi:hypothetical protein